MKQRLQQFDILKGILIISVVVGHAIKTPLINVFWFHVPAFFMIAGYFTNIPENNPLLDKQIWKKRIERYLIPYFSYCTIFYIFFHTEKPLKYFARVLCAGSLNVTEFTYPFWFISALFTGGIFFSALLYFPVFNGWRKLVIVIILRLFIHIKVLYPFSLYLPWSLDQIFGVVVFIYIGYFLKKYPIRKCYIIFPLFSLLFTIWH